MKEYRVKRCGKKGFLFRLGYKMGYASLIEVLTMFVSSEKIDSEVFLLSRGGRFRLFLLWLLLL
jgi:hypothetical protein